MEKCTQKHDNNLDALQVIAFMIYSVWYKIHFI